MRTGVRRLLIVQPQGIGDVIMMTPALSGLKAIEPELEIGVVVRTSVAADVLRETDLCDAVFVLDWRKAGLGATMRALRTIRTEFRPDVSIVAPHVSPFYGEPFAFLVGSGIRIGSHSVWPYGGFTIELPTTLRMHKTEAMLAYARALFPSCPKGRLHCGISVGAEEEASRISNRLGLSSAVVLGVHPGTDESGTMRRYSPDYYGQVIRAFLAAIPGARVLVFLGPSDQDLKECFRMEFGMHVLTNLPIGVVAALIRRTTVFLGSDSALVHVAAAVGVPVVTIFGPADPTRSRPWSERGSLVRHRPLLSCMPCIDSRLYNACRMRPCLSSLLPAQVFSVVRDAVRAASLCH